MAELKAHLGEELVSMAALTWLIGLVQMFYNVWRIFVDHQLLLGITFTRIQPDLGYFFNWDVSNIFLVARFFTNVLGIVAACILTLGNWQRMLKRPRIGLEECIAGWRSPELQNVDSFTQSKSFKPNFTQRKVRKLRQI